MISKAFACRIFLSICFFLLTACGKDVSIDDDPAAAVAGLSADDRRNEDISAAVAGAHEELVFVVVAENTRLSPGKSTKIKTTLNGALCDDRVAFDIEVPAGRENDDLGEVSSSGVYTAPSKIPDGLKKVKVTVSLKARPDVKATVELTLEPERHMSQCPRPRPEPGCCVRSCCRESRCGKPARCEGHGNPPDRTLTADAAFTYHGRPKGCEPDCKVKESRCNACDSRCEPCAPRCDRCDSTRGSCTGGWCTPDRTYTGDTFTGRHKAPHHKCRHGGNCQDPRAKDDCPREPDCGRECERKSSCGGPCLPESEDDDCGNCERERGNSCQVPGQPPAWPEDDNT